MTLQPVTPQSLVDMITRQLEAAIISGELAPGDRISEQALAKNLGVSRGPLREAISRLEGRRLIERKPNFGARIASLSREDLNEILIVREALEGMAARLAAQRMNDTDLAALRRLLGEHGRLEGVRTGSGYLQEGADFDFHHRIIMASGNQRLINMLCGELYDLLRIYRYKSSTLNRRASDAYGEHVDIVEALEARDAAAAEAAMRRHLRNAREHMLAMMGS